MRQTTFFFVFMICIVHNLSAQFLSPEYIVDASLDYNTKIISGTCKIKLQTELSTLKIKLTANAFSSQQTHYAKHALLYENDFYFYKDEEYGGYSNITMTANGQSIPIDFRQEILTVELPANGTYIHELDIRFELKLPKQLHTLGWNNHYIHLQDWYPVIAYHDGEKWVDKPFVINSFRSESFGLHQVNLQVEKPYVVLSNHKTETTDSLSYQMTVRGKSLQIIVIDKNEIIEIPGDAQNKKVFVVNYKRRKKEKRHLVLNQVLPSTLLVLEKSLPLLQFENYLFLHNNVRKRYYQHYFLDDVFDQFLKDNYHIPNEQLWFYSVLEWKYIQYLFSKIPKIQNSKQFIDGDYYNCQSYQKALQFFDYNESPDVFLNSNVDEKIKFCIENGIGLTIFANLENQIGKDELFKLTGEYLSQQFHKEISKEGYLHFLSSAIGKDLLPLLQSHESSESRPDYEILETTLFKDSISMTIENKGLAAVPFMLEEKSESGQKIFWIEGFNGKKTVRIPGRLDYNEGNVSVKLDPLRLNREVSTQNQEVFLPLESSSTDRKIKIKSLSFLGRRIKVFPVLFYNTTNKLMLGIQADNIKQYPLKGFEYSMMPAYSFGASKIVGDGWMAYNYMKSKKFDNIRFEALIKTYDDFHQDSLDYFENYVKFQPSVTLFKGNFYDRVRRELIFRPIFLWKNEGKFVDRNYVGLEKKSSQIYLVEYKQTNAQSLGKLELFAAMEYQPYTSPFGDNEQYAKSTLSVKKYFAYNPEKKISVRFFGSLFLFNTQKNSTSYNSVFTRGSIPLFQQGYNDYRLDDYYFDRAGTSSFFSHQTSNFEGGGFKQTPEAAFNFGMSNRYAFATNFVFDMPIRKLKILKLYFDAGVYGNAQKENIVLYTGGVMLDISDGIRIYYPLVQSQDIRFLLGNEFLSWNKLSFSIDINGIRRGF